MTRQIIDNWNYDSIVSRAIKDGLSAEAVPSALAELKDFFAECARSDADLAPQSQECDKLWHSFILDTRSYMHFCQMVYGEYLHHEVNASSETLAAAHYNVTLALGESGAQAAACGRIQPAACGRIQTPACGRIQAVACGRIQAAA